MTVARATGYDDPGDPGDPGDADIDADPDLVVGVGARSGVTTEEVLALVDATLAHLGASRGSVRHLATAADKAAEPGIVEAAQRAGWQIVAHPAAVLAGVRVPNPSARVRTATGTPSVAEAACLLSTNGRPVHGAELVAGKRSNGRTTIAVARHP
jgi:cobalamin biosynthesis protein CbiG